MKYSSRFFLYAPLCVFLLLLAIAGIHWWIDASELARWLDARNGREIMPGVTLNFSARHITGFPFSLDTEMHDVTVSVATGKGTISWQSEKLALHGLAYGRDETIFEAAGHQSLRWAPATDASGNLNFAVAALRASAIREHQALQRFDLDIVGLGSAAFTAQRLQFHIRRGAADRLDTMVLAEGIRPAQGTCQGLGDQVKDLKLVGTITQADAFSDLAKGDEALSAALVRWRVARTSGVVDIQSLWLEPPPYLDRDGLIDWTSHALNALKASLNNVQAETLVPSAARVLCQGPSGWMGRKNS
jgi:hypothetical protein